MWVVASLRLTWGTFRTKAGGQDALSSQEEREPAHPSVPCWGRQRHRCSCDDGFPAQVSTRSARLWVPTVLAEVPLPPRSPQHPGTAVLSQPCQAARSRAAELTYPNSRGDKLAAPACPVRPAWEGLLCGLDERQPGHPGLWQPSVIYHRLSRSLSISEQRDGGQGFYRAWALFPWLIRG